MTTETLSFFASPWWVHTRGLWQRVARLGRRAPRRLRLRESLPLGEHRFVAVIEFEGKRLLIGGTSSSLVLLTQLESANEEQPQLAEGKSAGTAFEKLRFQELKEEELKEREKRGGKQVKTESRTIC
jgi:flagellar biogenesis protein FliO